LTPVSDRKQQRHLSPATPLTSFNTTLTVFQTTPNNTPTVLHNMLTT